MSVLRPILATLLLLGLASGARAGEPPAADELVKAKLVSEVSRIGPGAEPFWLGVRLEMKEGWHTYWKNPGDSGLPTKIEWTLPEGFEASPIHWPSPELFDSGGLASHGYSDEVLLLAKVEPKAVAKDAPVEVKANVSWLACEEICIPGRAELTLALRGGEATVAGDGKAEIEKAIARLPREAKFPVSFDAAKELLTLRVRDAALSGAKGAHFFPAEDGVLENVVEQPLVREDGGFALRLKPSAYAAEPPEELRGVLSIEGGEAFEVVAKPAAAAALGAPTKAPDGPVETPPAPKEALGLAEVLLLALLGGIVLNLMPCVFPVLSLKVLGIAQQASETPRRIKLHGVAYTAGILASFALLAGVLVALRAGGARIGWGFQLQSPAFVALLSFVLFAMALSLSGVVQFGGSIMGVGSSLASRPGLSGSFFTGVLATVVATPCTAPFMGAAVGFALTQPAALAIAVFLALGFGLALPFLALSFAPAMHRLLPRPGAWMETLKQILAFPLYGTVAWLVWVLHLQAGPEGLAAVLAGLVLVGFAAWAYGSSRLARPRMRRVGALSAAIATAGALALLQLPTRAQPAEASATPAAAGYEPFSEARLEALLAAKKPVFVNFTAAWCVTCLANERNALGTDGVKEAFAAKGITYLKGDWTNEDPVITTVLERFGRSGVPLYLLYDGRGGEPVVLPQLLTEDTVIEHLEKI